MLQTRRPALSGNALKGIAILAMTVTSRSTDDCAMTGVAFHASMSL